MYTLPRENGHIWNCQVYCLKVTSQGQVQNETPLLNFLKVKQS